MISFSKRLQKEAAALAQASADAHIPVLRPIQGKITEWEAVIVGPEDSWYEGYQFKLSISVPSEYPMIPPNIKFVTKIFHPNVHFEKGEICLDILKKEWSPAWTLQAACRAIVALLGEPAADSPLNCDAGNMLRAGDVRAFRSMAKLYCIEHCEPK